MPATTDEKLLALSREAIEVFDKVNGGVHPGFGPAHAKGILLTVAFTPSPEAALSNQFGPLWLPKTSSLVAPMQRWANVVLTCSTS
jgi:catalase